MILYTDIDPFCFEWIRGLFDSGQLPDGIILRSDVREIDPALLSEIDQAHFFAGIGGWAYAIELAGWPRDWPVWTGSCPCQPWSVAGRGKREDDERHIWPAWFRIIRECEPPIIFGEQVASPAARAWFDIVSADLESTGYAVGSANLCACGVGAPHIRQRLYWVAISGSIGQERFADAKSETRSKPRSFLCGNHYFWEDKEWLSGRDGKFRPAEPSSFPLAHGLPRSLGRLRPWERKLAEVAGADVRNLKEAGRNRVGRLRGYGNAIVPHLAAEFIRAVMEIIR
jgi:DNA (cytosine-5)-methyltransferase 1